MEFENLPEGWKKCKIREIGMVVSGGTPSTKDSSNFDGDIGWITPADLSGYKEKYISYGKRNLSQKGYTSCSAKLMPRNSVIFTSRAPIGYVAIAGNDVCTNQGFKSIIPNDNIGSDYLYYYLQYAKHFIISKASGTTFKEISLKAFNEIPVILPPIHAQKKIVIRIEELLSELDKGICELKQAEKLLAIYKIAVLNNTLSAHQDKTTTLSTIVDQIRIGPFGTMLHQQDYIRDGIPIINPKHIRNGVINPENKNSITDQKASELESYKLQKNDIILGRRGEMGRCAPITTREEGWLCGTGSMIIRLKPEYQSAFYARVLSSPKTVNYLDSSAKGTTMKNLNEGIVKQIPVPDLTISEQNDLLNELEARLSGCEHIQRTINTSIQKVQTLRQSILKQAFEGKLV